MNGTLYCVSVGPGDPELLTLKAVRIIRQCPVIAVSAGSTAASSGRQCIAYKIAAAAVPEIGQKELLALHMPMTRDRELLERGHREAARALIETLRLGKDVAWLNLGDVSIYSSSAYGARQCGRRDLRLRW